MEKMDHYFSSVDRIPGTSLGGGNIVIHTKSRKKYPFLFLLIVKLHILGFKHELSFMFVINTKF
jgi:hypothetical protein